MLFERFHRHRKFEHPPRCSTMSNLKPKIIPLTKENYLRFIKNSVGSKNFQKFYALVGGKKKDILRDGDLSCAYFVSSVLKIFDLIGKVHVTVSGTVKDMKKSGWRETKQLKEGNVLLWEARETKRETHKHIGFYVGGKKAISNSDKMQVPVRHSFTFGNKRKIEKIFWNIKLN